MRPPYDGLMKPFAISPAPAQPLKYVKLAWLLVSTAEAQQSPAVDMATPATSRMFGFVKLVVQPALSEQSEILPFAPPGPKIFAIAIVPFAASSLIASAGCPYGSDTLPKTDPHCGRKILSVRLPPSGSITSPLTSDATSLTDFTPVIVHMAAPFPLRRNP